MADRSTLAALYVRVSTTDKQHPANQVEPLQQWCREAGYAVFDVYSDAESGGSSTRPRFGQMMADAAARKFGIIICWSLDRFTREGVAETFLYIKRLKASRVDFYSLTEEYFRTTGPAGELLIAVAAWIAESERRVRRERVKAGLDRARAAGTKLGRKPTEFTDEQRAEMLTASEAGNPYSEIAKHYSTSKANIGRIIKAERNKIEMQNGPTAPDATGQQKPVIQSIARFAGPRGHLNKLGVKVPGEFALSVKRKSGTARVWRAMWYGSNRPFETANGNELTSEMYSTLKAEVESYFDTKVKDWQDFTE